MPTEQVKKKGKSLHAIGKRKTAIAHVKIVRGGTGAIMINKKDIGAYFLDTTLKQVISHPLELVGMGKEVDVHVKILGGGTRGQAEAIRHGIARALEDDDQTLRPILKKAGYLTRDPRSKERKKYGLKKARRAPQWQKR